MPATKLIKSAAVLVATMALSTVAYAGCNSGSYCDSSAATSYSSYQSQSSYYQPAPQVVPFSTSVSSVSHHRIDGMGPNERLCPTKCPVDVYNPEGGKVLGCYNVCKTAPVVRPVQVQSYIRVVRPIIYVRYPVPTPVPVPVCVAGPVCAPPPPPVQTCGPVCRY